MRSTNRGSAAAVPAAVAGAQQPVGQPRKGRGAVSNPDCRYDSLRTAAFDDGWAAEESDEAFVPPPPRTTVSPDPTRTIIARTASRVAR